MDDRTRRYEGYEEAEDELRLDQVLEPYQQEAYEQPGLEEDYAPPLQEPPYEQPPYEEEYSDYHEAMDEAMDEAGRFRVAMGVFDTVSILVGVVVILALVAMLVSLVSWLRSDILHSALLLQSGLQ